MAARTVEVTLTTKDRISREYRRVKNTIGKNNKEIRDSMKRVKQESKKTNDAIKSGLNQSKAAYLALSGVVTGVVAKSFIDTQRSVDKINRTLKIGIGTVEGAAIEYEFLAQEAERLGLKIQSTSIDYAQFTAAAKNSTLTASQQREIFLGVSEASAAMSLSADDATGAMRALQQMISKGTVQSEELRGQLGERIPGAFSLAAKAMGLTEKQLGKQLELGNVLAADLLPKLAAEMRKTFGEEAAKGPETLNGKINALQNTLFRVQKELLAGGGADLLTDAFEKAAEAVELFGENIDIIIAAGKIFATVFAAKKIVAITNAIIAMNLKLNASVPIYAALTAGLIGLEAAMHLVEKQADELAGKEGAFSNLQDLKNLQSIIIEAERLKGVIDVNRKAVIAGGEEGAKAAQREIDARIELIKTIKRADEIAGKGFITEQSNFQRKIKDLDLNILKLVQKKDAEADAARAAEEAAMREQAARRKAAEFEAGKGERSKAAKKAAQAEKERQRALEAGRLLQDELLVMQQEGRNQELLELQLWLGEKQEVLNAASEDNTRLLEVYRSEEARINEEYDALDLEREKDKAKKELVIQKNLTNSKLGIAKQGLALFGELAGESKAFFLATKAIAAAEVVVNTMRGVAAALALGPAGIPTIPFIKGTGALALTTILAQTIKGFANGGFVTEGATTGDKTLARVNKNEVILNPGQQRNFMALANGKGNAAPTSINIGDVNVNVQSGDPDAIAQAVSETRQEQIRDVEMLLREKDALLV